MSVVFRRSVALLLATTLLSATVILPAASASESGQAVLPAAADAPPASAAPEDSAVSDGPVSSSVTGTVPAVSGGDSDQQTATDADKEKNKDKDQDNNKDKDKDSKKPTDPAADLQLSASAATTGDSPLPLRPHLADPLQQVADVTGRHTVNEFSGNFGYAYPLALPAGRNGLTPDVTLTYNSSDRSITSPVGYGWNLSLPKIERFTRSGAANLYLEKNFSSPFAGDSGELIADSVDGNGYGIYVPKAVVGQYQHEYLSDKTWRVTDGSGTVYRFGSTADTWLRMQSAYDLAQARKKNIHLQRFVPA